MNQKNQIVVVGASGGIGQKLCYLLKDSGYPLFLVARDRVKLQVFAEEIGADWKAADLSSSTSAKELFEEAQRKGKVQGIVNLAGSIVLKPAHSTSDDEWQSVISQNLTTAFNCIKFGIRLLESGGSIVLMSSAAATIGLANHEAIAAAKAGVIGLTRSAAASYATRGIRVNCLAPGLVRTPLSASLTSNANAEKASVSLHPMKRLGEAGDIAPLIRFLLSEDSAWITGQVIGADGGLANLKTF